MPGHIVNPVNVATITATTQHPDIIIKLFFFIFLAFNKNSISPNKQLKKECLWPFGVGGWAVDKERISSLGCRHYIPGQTKYQAL